MSRRNVRNIDVARLLHERGITSEKATINHVVWCYEDLRDQVGNETATLGTKSPGTRTPITEERIDKIIEVLAEVERVLVELQR